MKRPIDGDDDENNDITKARKMRKLARAKASRMTRAPSPTPSVQTLDQITDEERAEILKFVETEQAQVCFCFSFTQKVLTVGHIIG